MVSDAATGSTFYTSKEIAALLEVNQATLCEWRQLGVGPPWYKVVGRYRYDKVAFRAWHQSIRENPDE
jgi:hypothetical protein